MRVSLGDGEVATVLVADVVPAAVVEGGSTAQACEEQARPSGRTKRTLADLVAEESGEALAAALASSRVRVLNKASRFAAGHVVVDRLDRANSMATVRLSQGQRTESLPLCDLEVVVATCGTAATAAAGAAALREEARFGRLDYVRIVDGERCGKAGFRGEHSVVRALGDDRYEVQCDGGRYIFAGKDLAHCVPKYNQRPDQRIEIPLPPAGSQWTGTQLDALTKALHVHQNLYITGMPASGKTELTAALAKAIGAAGYNVHISARDNALVAFLKERLAKCGVPNVETLVGTDSAKTWASLGASYVHERKEELVEHMLGTPFIRRVVKDIREAHVWIFEEDENKLSYFKDVQLDIFSLLCGHTGAEPGANKQLIFISDERQLGGIQVHHGDIFGNYGLLDGGAVRGGGTMKETHAFESQCLQAFYPRQPVRDGHIAASFCMNTHLTLPVCCRSWLLYRLLATFPCSRLLVSLCAFAPSATSSSLMCQVQRARRLLASAVGR